MKKVKLLTTIVVEYEIYECVVDEACNHRTPWEQLQVIAHRVELGIGTILYASTRRADANPAGVGSCPTCGTCDPYIDSQGTWCGNENCRAKLA